VSRKLRWCAFGLLGYFILNKLIMWSQEVGANPFGVLFSLVFLLFLSGSPGHLGVSVDEGRVGPLRFSGTSRRGPVLTLRLS